MTLRGLTQWLLAIALMGGLCFARPAHAAMVDLGLGADYWTVNAAEFNLTLGLRGRLGRHLSLGARFGALLITGDADQPLFGVPLDMDLRVHVDEVYLDGLVGPWILFTGAPVRAHAAFGFGLQERWVSIGLEVGYLQPAAMVGLRLGFPLS